MVSDENYKKALSIAADVEAHRLTTPEIRSMYPIRSRGQMKNEFTHCIKFGAEFAREYCAKEKSKLGGALARSIAGIPYDQDSKILEYEKENAELSATCLALADALSNIMRHQMSLTNEYELTRAWIESNNALTAYAPLLKRLRER